METDNFKIKMQEYEQMFFKTYGMPRKQKKRERRKIKELSVTLIYVYTMAKEQGLTY